LSLAPTKEKLAEDVVSLIISSVNLHHRNRAEINLQTQIVKEGLELDSLDLLEIIVAIEEKYKIKIGDATQGEQIFKNIGSLVDFIWVNAKFETA